MIDRKTSIPVSGRHGPLRALERRRNGLAYRHVLGQNEIPGFVQGRVLAEEIRGLAGTKFDADRLLGFSNS